MEWDLHQKSDPDAMLCSNILKTKKYYFPLEINKLSELRDRFSGTKNRIKIDYEMTSKMECLAPNHEGSKSRPEPHPDFHFGQVSQEFAQMLIGFLQEYTKLLI